MGGGDAGRAAVLAGAGDAGAALEAGEFAIEAGRRGGDVDLELLGRALRGLGRVATPRTAP